MEVRILSPPRVPAPTTPALTVLDLHLKQRRPAPPAHEKPPLPTSTAHPSSGPTSCTPPAPISCSPSSQRRHPAPLCPAQADTAGPAAAAQRDRLLLQSGMAGFSIPAAGCSPSSPGLLHPIRLSLLLLPVKPGPSDWTVCVCVLLFGLPGFLQRVCAC
jgi:hypothetical protein